MADNDRPEEESAAEEMAARQAKLREVETTSFTGVQVQDGNPVNTVRLTPTDSFGFSCDKGVSCWNVC